jgi:Ca-activated chloride channel family protein
MGERMTMGRRKTQQRTLVRISIALSLLMAVALLAYGSWHDPNFWRTASQRGDALIAQKAFEQAATTYSDPWHIGVAQYRDGNFEAAALTFARVPGATGAYNQGNAWLMLGKYEDAIASYDRALGFQPLWQDAIDNKALAAARKKRRDDAGDNREQESADAYNPDDTVVDEKGEDDQGKPLDINDAQLSDAELRATWLRRVQTSPGDFLRAKFAYQVAHATPTASEERAQ